MHESHVSCMFVAFLGWEIGALARFDKENRTENHLASNIAVARMNPTA